MVDDCGDICVSVCECECVSVCVCVCVSVRKRGRELSKEDGGAFMCPAQDD